MSQLVNAKVNSDNRKAVFASNYATRIRGCHSALRECIMYMYKVTCLTRKTIELHTHSDYFSYAKQGKGHGHVHSFGGFA